MGERRGPPDISGMFTLKVDNCTYRTRPDDLRDLFSKYGKIGDIFIPRDHRTGDSRGFAYYDEKDARDAMEGLDGTDVDGRQLRIQEALQTRSDKPRVRGRLGQAEPAQEDRDRDRRRDRSPDRRRDRDDDRRRDRDDDRDRRRDRDDDRDDRRRDRDDDRGRRDRDDDRDDRRGRDRDDDREDRRRDRDDSR